DAELARLRAAIGARPVWLAASLHPGETEAIAHVHATLAKTYPDLLTLIVPRHPPPAPEIVEIAAKTAPVQLRSQGRDLRGDTAIYIADTLGELGLFYRLAKIVFIGGSFVEHGGQNPLEAARLGCAILFGPHMHNFGEMAVALLNEKAAEQV